MRNRLALSAFLFVIAAGPLSAQGGTSVYPSILYPGENIVTITNGAGIETVRAQATSNTRVTVPSVSGCPTSVDVRVWIDNPTTAESVDFTVYDCRGRFGSTRVLAENWEIRQEFTGPVQLGRDTCLRCQVITSGSKTIDSIVVDGARLKIRMPSARGPWYSTEADPLQYQICYDPQEIEQVEQSVRLYVRRNQPNGGLTHYMIAKPIVMKAVPAPPPVEKKPDRVELPLIPPLVDPTTFRNIVMPTAETLTKGKSFVGTYDVVGLLAGYGVTDELMVMAGGAFVPDFLSSLAAGTIGAKYNALSLGNFLATAGFQYGISSTEQSDISLAAPYLLLSYGSRSSRLTVGAGYSWKHHTLPNGAEFDRNAFVAAVGGDVTVKRGWKLAAETYIIESSGLAPIALSSRWFNDELAFDVGFVLDVAGSTDVNSTGTLSGEITDLRIAPILSLLWVF